MTFPFGIGAERVQWTRRARRSMENRKERHCHDYASFPEKVDAERTDEVPGRSRILLTWPYPAYF